jgi:uncharacterized protein YbjQ (UPF0145 family)
VLAGAISAPCSIATPSNPIAPELDELAVPDVLAVGDVLDELLLPQPAISSKTASRGRSRSRRDIGSSTVAGDTLGDVSDAAPPMTTAFELPGLRITENLGICYGLVVRSMGFTGGVAASFKGLRRGEISEYTQLLEDSRRHAIDRMLDNARLMGADAVIAVRFDSSEIGGQFTEIVAYGTAVKVHSAS